MNYQKNLRYGLRAKIYKDSNFFPATIYLDPIYDNFIWIATVESSFLVDLSFASISFYYLELELDIKNSSDTPDEANKKYIILKELNTEVPIIFN
jgi:hypothetical protein